MAKCSVCAKRPQAGNNVSHSKRRTRRTWMPNIRTTHVLVNGVRQRIKLCTRCLRTQYRTA
ncbi:MAG: 50S ribosomal protein L28 [Chloroflexi bacterium]|nr:50S ribosomal protein L28 [Chloroflexota bacterium]